MKMSSPFAPKIFWRGQWVPLILVPQRFWLLVDVRNKDCFSKAVVVVVDIERNALRLDDVF